MDPMESKARLSCSLLESCEIFNALFGGITTIRNQVQSRTETIISTQEVNLDAFSPDQKHAVKQLAGLLIDMSIALPSIDAPAIETGKRHEVEKLLDEKNLLERKYKRTIAALQDYLSQELTRAEELETKLQAKEMELVNVVAERDKYLKKFQQENTGSSQAHAKATSSQTQLSHSLKSRVTETEVFNPQDWIGRYIRKGFGSNYYFGIVVHFDAPYFKVIYEDADEEELARAEISRLFWHQTVPSHKVEQIKKHSRAILASKLQPHVGAVLPPTLDKQSSDDSKSSTEQRNSFEGELALLGEEEKFVSLDKLHEEFEVAQVDDQAFKRSRVE